MATVLEPSAQREPQEILEQSDAELLAEFEAPIRRQERVRAELYRIIDEVLDCHCPAFRTWRTTNDTETWAEIPSEALLLRSQHFTGANIAITGQRYAAHDEIRNAIESACEHKASKLLKLRSEELNIRRQKNVSNEA